MTDKEKSIPVLEKEKLEIEIKLLKQNLEKEKKEGLGTKNFGEIIRKNIALILAVISVLGGVFGIILPVNQYFEEKKKEMIPILNKEIISLVGKLNSNSETTRQEATVMLNYYGLDAIPVLLLRLERSMNETEVLRLILAIKNIHDHNDPGVLDEILYSFKVEFEKNYTIANSSEISYHKINNYKDLLMKLDLSRKEKRTLKDLIKELEGKIPKLKNEEFAIFFTEDLNTICNHFSIDSVKIAM